METVKFRFRGKKYKLCPGLSAFVRGIQNGAGWAFGFGFVLLMFFAFFMAAWNYAAYH